MADRVTLRDVALRAGVGKSTVSNVLAGSGRVSDATRDRVRAAVEELGYVPNAAARQLRGGRTGMLGVYVPGVPSTSEFYMRFVFGIMERAAAQGSDTTILSASRPDARRALDGVIVADAHEDDAFARGLLASSTPVVCFERPTGVGVADGVLWADHRRALTVLLDHMAASGATRPALVLPPETGDWAVQLGSAYRSWCATAEVGAVVVPVPWVPSAAEVEGAVAAALDHAGVDGLVCAPVDTAPTAVRAIEARGLSVGPGGVLVASATESTSLRLGHPPVTSLDLDPSTAGRRCADLLARILDGGEGGEHIHPVVLHRRASTGGEGDVTVG